jgi:hypothetical protein
VFHKGISTNRDDNSSNFDYVLKKDAADEGIRYYMHKYFAGYEHVYFLKSNEKFQGRFKSEMLRRNK